MRTPGPIASDNGVSLVGTLVVVITLGVLSYIVVDALSGGDSPRQRETKALLDELNGSGTSQPAAATVTTRPPSLTSGARIAACESNYKVIVDAISTKYATDGAYPASLDQLVSGHWLDAVPTSAGYRFSLEVVSGQPTGQVLVNGQSGLAGCEAGPKEGQ